MKKIIHKVGIKGSAESIYQALTTNEGLARWWTEKVSGAGDVGSTIHFHFDAIAVLFKVSELVANKKVSWTHTGDMPPDWHKTTITFKLTETPEQTLLFFEHSNWSDYSDFMAHCSSKWVVFLLSLKQAIETGKGQPFPNDVAIDHN